MEVRERIKGQRGLSCEGRMKLSGTILYPKNRYLTSQFSRGGKNVMCEDWFDTMIVFSDAFWVGKKEENPDEARLEFPKELYEGAHPEVDFKGGAGATATKRKNLKKVVTMSTEEKPLSGSPVDEMEAESPERHQNMIDLENSTFVRQSGRTAGKRFNFFTCIAAIFCIEHGHGFLYGDISSLFSILRRSYD